MSSLVQPPSLDPSLPLCPQRYIPSPSICTIPCLLLPLSLAEPSCNGSGAPPPHELNWDSCGLGGLSGEMLRSHCSRAQQGRAPVVAVNGFPCLMLATRLVERTPGGTRQGEGTCVLLPLLLFLAEVGQKQLWRPPAPVSAKDSDNSSM